MTSVRRSIAYSSLTSWTGVVFQVIGTVVVARILTPEQTGVFAVAAVFAALASNVRDFGVGEYLIQEKELDTDTIRAALTVNIIVSWSMCALLLACAPLAASFYREPGVGQVMRVQALSFLLIPFGAVTMAWFRREMDFRPPFVIGMVANVVNLVTMIWLALRGHGYMSLAWASLANNAATVGLSILMRPKGFPRWPGLRGVRKVLHFGTFVSGIYIFGQLGKGAPEMIIGRAGTMADVGIFGRAQGLVEIFNRLVVRAVMPVALPMFAKAERETGSPRPGLLVSMTLLTAVGWPFLAFMAVMAYSAVRIMYGAQWMDAVPLAKLLCAAAAAELLYATSKEVLLAKGLPRQSSALQIGMQALRIVGLLAIVPWGLEGAAWGLLFGTVTGSALSHVYLARYVGLRAGEVLRASAGSALVTLVAIGPLATWTLWRPVDEHNYLAATLLGGGACLGLWLLALRQTRHPLWQEVVRIGSAVRAKLRS